MPQYFLGTEANKVGDIEIDSKTAGLRKVTMYPAVDQAIADKKGGTHNLYVATEWLVKHPTQPLLVALTSFWNRRASQLTCFSTAGKELQKVTECSTAGREACHAMFYPRTDGQSKVTLAVAHHNDATITFFQFPTNEMPTDLDGQPALTIELPELVAGTRKILSTGNGRVAIPSSHQVYYAPNGNYLLVVDPNQSAIFTYLLDDTGLPIKSQEPSSKFKCHTNAPALGWFTTAAKRVMGFSSCRPRRVAVSPNNEYVFINYEPSNVIQVYTINTDGQIDVNGKGCMQETSTLDVKLTKSRVIGFTYQAAGEMEVHGNSLYVSNRGTTIVAGRKECSVRIYDIRDGGRLALPHAVVCSGPVHHFCVYEKDGDDYLVAGTAKPTMALETFRRKHDDENAKYELIGEAEVGETVFCVVQGNV